MNASRHFGAGNMFCPRRQSARVMKKGLAYHAAVNGARRPRQGPLEEAGQEADGHGSRRRPRKLGTHIVGVVIGSNTTSYTTSA